MGPAAAAKARQSPVAGVITPTTPLRLEMAAKLAFPDGSMGVAGLRKEIERGNLLAEKIAGRIYVTLDGIEEMRVETRNLKGPQLYLRDAKRPGGQRR